MNIDMIRYKYNKYNSKLLKKFEPVYKSKLKQYDELMKKCEMQGGKRFANSLAEIHPNNIDNELTFGGLFDQPIEKDILPRDLLTLNFGWNFNQPIKQNVLPQKLQTLTFGMMFDQPIEQNVLPQSLKTLVFGYFFNHPIKQNVLPKELETLIFGEFFNQIIEPHTLPQNLQQLIIRNENHPQYNMTLDDSWKQLKNNKQT